MPNALCGAVPTFPHDSRAPSSFFVLFGAKLDFVVAFEDKNKSRRLITQKYIIAV